MAADLQLNAANVVFFFFAVGTGYPVVRQIIKTVFFTLLVLNPVWADDIEIFFNVIEDETTQPNILFVLDGSGSMNIYDCADGEERWYNSCNDGTPNGTTSRLTRMTQALTDILVNTNDINVGMMRFSHASADGRISNGGRIVYPIQDIDSVHCGGAPCPEPETHTVVTTVDQQDASSEDPGSSRSSHLNIDGNGSIAGLSFVVDIPQGATIQTASLRVVTSPSVNQNRNSLQMKITAEDNTNPSLFTGRNNLKPRPRFGNIPWDDTPAGITDLPLTTPDISPLIEDIINRGDWSEGNRINLFFEFVSGDNNSRRGYQSWNANRGNPERLAANSPVLTITYTESAPEATVIRSELIQTANDFLAEGSTPAVGALLEAQRYFAGDEVVYGKQRITSGSERTSRVSHPDSYTGGNHVIPPGCGDDLNDTACGTERIDGSPVYTSPITQECQQNHVILLTDGVPDWNPDTRLDVQALIGGSCPEPFAGAGDAADLGRCGPELARYMNSTDLDLDLPGSQHLTVHTIGFNLLDNRWLTAVSKAGGGTHTTAESADELTAAVTSILTEVAVSNTTFVAPGATVDQFSRLAHREDIYLALFEPGKKHGWNGNLKKYEIRGLPPAIFDVNRAEAVDTENGVFKDGARSFWSQAVDGNNTLLGGAASLLEPDDRNLVSYFGGVNTELFSASNKISTNNPFVTEELLNADSDTELTQMIDWLSGMDVFDEDGDSDTTDSRQHLGDPLHTQPQLITYGGTQNDPDSMVVFGTNDGFIHGVDTRNGSEEFAFMPNTLFENVKKLYDNLPLADSNDRVYGMDGDLTVWINEENDNGIVEANESVYLYAGMRRGGRDYWVLDLTDRNNPKYKAHIEGGQGDFVELGETWSKPTLAQINIGGTVRQVLIFAGGYDNAQDEKTIRSDDSVGRAVYIVDAENPTQILWSGSGNPDASILPNTESFDKMRYSIPSDVLVVNDGADNLTSQIYVGDMGGQLWRFDVNNGAGEGPDLVSGGVIAELAGDDEQNARKFYFPPDLSLAIVNNQQFLNIGIGSGYEAHPLDTTIKDHFHVIRYPYHATGNYGTTDSGISRDDYRPIEMKDLYDATDNVIGQGTDVQIENAQQELSDSRGWFIELPRPGEKILGASTTLDNITRFISYVPAQSHGNSCLPNLGTSYYWSMNLTDGTPNRQEYEGRINLKDTDRYTVIATPGKAAAVKVLFTTGEDANGKTTITPTDVSGINVLSEGNSTEQTKRWYWSEYPE